MPNGCNFIATLTLIQKFLTALYSYFSPFCEATITTTPSKKMDIFSPFEEERKGKVKIIPLRKTLFFPNWLCIWLVRTRTRTYTILSASALRRNSTLKSEKMCKIWWSGQPFEVFLNSSNLKREGLKEWRKNELFLHYFSIFSKLWKRQHQHFHKYPWPF